MQKKIRKSGAATAAADQTINNSASPAGDSQQIHYTAKEEKLIRPIAEALRAVDKYGDKIGKLVDKLIAEKGGIEYGEQTIERIASHPDVNCSAQHLRRCWNLYRFNSAYSSMISPEHEKLCRSAKYQIARLLDLEMDVKEMLVIVEDCIHQIVKRRLTVDEVRDMVSRRLDEFGKPRKKPKKATATVATSPVVVVSDEFDLVNIADSISWMSDPEKFEVRRILAPETRMGLTRLIGELVSISYRLPEGGPNEDFGNILMKKGRELVEIGRQLLESTEHSTEEE